MMIYVLSDLLLRNPKIIITSIDNCEKFAWLGRLKKGVHFVGSKMVIERPSDVDAS